MGGGQTGWRRTRIWRRVKAIVTPSSGRECRLVRTSSWSRSARAALAWCLWPSNSSRCGRKVALKIIKPGMDSREVIARFEAERQALAMMDHPNIAQGARRRGDAGWAAVLRDGTGARHPDHRVLRPEPPFAPRSGWNCSFRSAMRCSTRIKRGSSIATSSRRTCWSRCTTATPVVKVIDFGVAKAIGQQLTERTIYTRFAQMIGTPLYMSPEQAEMSGLDIDTRSDIYSLGVLLYELLTGATPFDRRRIAERRAFDEIRRIIREEEPPRPSQRFSTLGRRPCPRCR